MSAERASECVTRRFEISGTPFKHPMMKSFHLAVSGEYDIKALVSSVESFGGANREPEAKAADKPEEHMVCYSVSTATESVSAECVTYPNLTPRMLRTTNLSTCTQLKR